MVTKKGRIIWHTGNGSWLHDLAHSGRGRLGQKKSHHIS